MTFTYFGDEYDYFDHHYNTTRLNERAVEIPIAIEFLSWQYGDGLEVGNVLGHYGIRGHRVVDLYEVAAGVDNVDLFDITDTYDWIVSISTVEHVRWDTPPQDPDGSVHAIEHLLSLVRPGGQMLITAPLGHQPHLDRAIKFARLYPTDSSVMVLTNGKDEWAQAGLDTWRPYGQETKWASAVWIAKWIK